MNDFAIIQSEYTAALTARDAAEERLSAAGRAYLAAQCRTFIGRFPSTEPGHIVRLYCNAGRGHEGECVNAGRKSQ